MTAPTRRRRCTYAALQAKALALPGVEASTSYGTPALKVRGKLMVRLLEDGETVAVRTTWEERERWTELHPELFFVTDHYRKGGWMLVRVGDATAAMLKPVLETAWGLSAPKRLVEERGRSS